MRTFFDLHEELDVLIMFEKLFVELADRNLFFVVHCLESVIVEDFVHLIDFFAEEKFGLEIELLQISVVQILVKGLDVFGRLEEVAQIGIGELRI